MTPVTAATLLVDPALPPGFDDTPNEKRSTAELDQWWDVPYAQTTPSGALAVRCLHGGAWDRSSALGTATTVEEAAELANTKLAEWVALRSRAVLHCDGDGRNHLIRPSARPDRAPEVILADCTREAAAAWVDQNEH